MMPSGMAPNKAAGISECAARAPSHREADNVSSLASETIREYDRSSEAGSAAHASSGVA